jgi:hypothetical protein
MSPEYVRPYIRAQKDDDSDAAGIAEATTRPWREPTRRYAGYDCARPNKA